jgi:sugar fermentation stimulation protein A
VNVQKLINAFFIKRINRFVIECKVEDTYLHSYLPNPGRLWELLQRGREVLLLKKDYAKKYDFFAVAVKLDNFYVLLDTHYNNIFTKRLIEEKNIDLLKGYYIEKEEYSIENRRFDFLLNNGRNKLVLEVKSCTLFYNNLAMFPDAPSIRAKKHVEKLAELSKKGVKTAILFIVYSPNVYYFLPEFNVDFDFAESLYRNRKNIIIAAYSINNFLSPNKSVSVRKVDIQWDILKLKLINRGCYMLIIGLDKCKHVTIGKLGTISFDAPYYIYVGSAMSNLNERINRHKRKNKRMFWHIDYLLKEAKLLHALPIRSEIDLECSVSKDISNISDDSIIGFGSSDCLCVSHLYKFHDNPLNNKKFIDILLRYRMGQHVLKNLD